MLETLFPLPWYLDVGLVGSTKFSLSFKIHYCWKRSSISGFSSLSISCFFPFLKPWRFSLYSLCVYVTPYITSATLTPCKVAWHSGHSCWPLGARGSRLRVSPASSSPPAGPKLHSCPLAQQHHRTLPGLPHTCAAGKLGCKWGPPPVSPSSQESVFNSCLVFYTVLGSSECGRAVKLPITPLRPEAEFNYVYF